MQEPQEQNNSLPNVSLSSISENKEETKILSEDQKAIQDRLDKERFAIKRLQELKNLWKYLAEIYGTKNRFSRKQFRRRFISEDNFCTDLIDDCIKFYGAHIKTTEPSIITEAGLQESK